MKATPEQLWKIGRNPLWLSLVSYVAYVTTIEVLGSNGQPWVSNIGYLIGFLFVAGGIIVWDFSIRFYARVHQELGITKSATYLAILIGMNIVSPFIFIAIEGRHRTFGIPLE